MVGVLVARLASTALLKYFYLAFTLFVTVQWVLNLKPKPSRQLPGAAGLAGFGAFMGVIAGLFGGGGAVVGVPFLTWCNQSIHRAIGTVAALGFPISIIGTLSYVAAGWGVDGMTSVLIIDDHPIVLQGCRRMRSSGIRKPGSGPVLGEGV